MQHEAINQDFLESYTQEFYRLKSRFDLENYSYITEEEITGDELLFRCMSDKENGGRYVADKDYKARRIDLDLYSESLYTPQIKSKLIRFLASKSPSASLIRSGHWYYPPGEGMRWHTNADTPYLRCYLNYSGKGDSYFKYYDQEQEKTVVSQDHRGWNLRTFEIGKQGKDLFWHSVYSNTDRVSLGFRIINNLK